MSEHEGNPRTEISLDSIVSQSIDRFYLAEDGHDRVGQRCSPREAAMSVIEQLNKRGLEPVEILQVAISQTHFEPLDLISGEDIDSAEDWSQLVNSITAEIVLLEMLEEEPSLNLVERFVAQGVDGFEFSKN